jgi:isopenicillin N synthase-like dioxygenase
MSPSKQPDDETLPPPPYLPPPLLSEAQILALAYQGHLPLALPPHLRDLYTQLNHSAARFFSLPSATKTALYSPVNGTELGYVSIPNEKDYISFRAQTAHAKSELEQLAAEVWQETYTLLYRILGDLAWAMNTSHDVWDKILDGVSPMPTRLEDATATFLRVFRYEPNTGIAESHTDLGLLTLCVGEGQGLQVRVNNSDGKDEWVQYAEPTLLVGKTLKTLSGGRIRAGVHRVLGNEGGRSSTVFALRPSIKHEIDMSVFPGGKGMVHMGELWKRMWSGAFNVNAPREVREKQKERQRGIRDDGLIHDGAYDVTNTLAAITG